MPRYPPRSMPALSRRDSGGEPLDDLGENRRPTLLPVDVVEGAERSDEAALAEPLEEDDRIEMVANRVSGREQPGLIRAISASVGTRSPAISSVSSGRVRRS
jgi:hypothetical protein